MIDVITTLDERKARREICDVCEHRVRILSADVCGVCHCPLSSKVIITAAKCPKGFWPIIIRTKTPT